MPVQINIRSCFRHEFIDSGRSFRVLPLESRSCDLISSATNSAKMSCIEVGIHTLIVESCGDQSNLPNIHSVGIITSPKWCGRPFTYLDLSTTKGRRSSSLPKESHSRSYSCGFSGSSTHQALRNPFWLCPPQEALITPRNRVVRHHFAQQTSILKSIPVEMGTSSRNLWQSEHMTFRSLQPRSN